MTDCWQLEDGTGNWELEDGTGCWLLESSSVVVAEGGPSGGTSKQVGVSLVKKQLDEPLGQRPKKKLQFITTAKLELKFKTKNFGKLAIRLRSVTESIVKSRSSPGVAYGQIQIILRAKAVSKLNIYSRIKAVSKLNIFSRIKFHELTSIFRLAEVIIDIKQFGVMEKIMDGVKKILKLSALFDSMDIIDLQKETRIKTFDFEEDAEEWKNFVKGEQRLRAFTHSSSFVGNVRYDQDEQSMRIILNGVIYHFCNVPQRIFDSFEGANSKGAFFNRNIKTQFDCS